MTRAATDRDLWQRLADGIQPPRTIAAAADEHGALYRDLLARPAAVAEPEAPVRRRRPGVARPPPVSPARA